MAAALLLVGLSAPAPRRVPGSGLVADAWGGLAYVLRNRGLRGLAITVGIYNLGNGALTVALPVLVLSRLHGGAAQVGMLFAVMGGAGIVAGLLTGRFDSEGIERELLAVGCAGTLAGLATLAMAPSYAVAAAAMAVIGLANGPLDIGLFSLRQRVTDPAWFGRAFAVSMSLNFIGYPAGSTVAGPLVARSVTASLAVASAFAAAALLAALVTVPGDAGGGATERDVSVARRTHPS